MNNKQLERAQIIFDYLCLKEMPAKADAVVGFGHFDAKIPKRCVSIYERKLADHIIFTGGIGAGTADLAQPEARYFKEVAIGLSPQLAPTIIVEDKSTNTAENVRFTSALLAEKHPNLVFGAGIKSMILVANAFRQRRVWLTVKKLLPDISLINCPATTTLAEEIALFKSKGEDLIPQLYGEVQRIQDYPAKDWIEKDEIPKEVLSIMADWKNDSH